MEKYLPFIIGEGIGTREECPFEIRSYVEFTFSQSDYLNRKSFAIDHRDEIRLIDD